MRRMRALLLIPVAAGVWACQSPTSSTATTAAVTLAANPNPTSAEASSGVFYKVAGTNGNPDETREYDWKTSFGVTLSETAGVGLDITAVSVKVQQASGGIITPPTNGDVEHYQFVSQSSGNRLEGHAQASVNFDVWYDLPNLGREAVVTVIFTFRDKKNVSDEFDDVSFTKSADVRVQ